jgi:hypothetical protein
MKCKLEECASIFIRENPIFSSERMLHKDYYRKNSVEKYLHAGLKGLDLKTKCLAVRHRSWMTLTLT